MKNLLIAFLLFYASLSQAGTVHSLRTNSDGNITASVKGGESLDIAKFGEWSPTLVGSTGVFSSITYSSQNGYFYKNGRHVMVTFAVSVSAATGGSGNIELHGLPFIAYGGSNYGSTCVFETSNIDYPAGRSVIIGNLPTGGNHINVRAIGDNVTTSGLSITAINSGSYNKILRCTMNYITK